MAEEILEVDIDEKEVISSPKTSNGDTNKPLLEKRSRQRKKKRYQLSGAGGTRSPPATPHSLQNLKWSSGSPKWPTQSGKVSNPRSTGCLAKQLTLLFFSQPPLGLKIPSWAILN